MSSKIDERVVQMKFNSGDFARGVAETSSALDKLKSALNLEGAAKGLQEVDAAGRNLSLAGIANGVADISSRFTGLQVVAIGALAAIGAKAVEVGQTLVQNLATNLTSAMRDGFSDYNMKLTSVQTIMNATGADIGTVNGYFKELDTYADKTVYNLSDMTGAFAKFTNAGIGMDQSVPAIKGIANMVALAGQGAGEASIAMYNLSQSLAGGFLTTTDYKSLNLANVATKEWKDNMIAAGVAAGTLGQNADGTYSILADGSGKVTTAAALFNEELATGWANTDVLLGVLGDYGDATTDIGLKALNAAQNVKSLPMMFETLAASAGTGWTDTFELILGNVTESTELFTYLTNEIGGFTNASNDARNAQLQLWKDAGGRTALFDALKNIFTALHSVLGPIGEAWKSVFPPSLGKTLTTISFAIRDFTAGLILSEGAQANLKMVATALFTVLKFGVDIVMGVVKVLGFLIGLAFDLGGAIFGLISPILTFVRSLMPVKEGAEDTTSAVSGFFDMLVGAGKFLTGWIITGLKALGDGFDNLLNGGVAVKRIQEFQAAMDKVIKTVLMVWNVMTKGDFTGGGFFAEDSKVVDVLFRIREGIVAVIEWFGQLGKVFSDSAGKAKSFWSGIGAVVSEVWGYIQPFVDGVRQFFGDIMSGLDLETVMAGVNAGVLVALGVGVGKLVKSFMKAFASVGDIKKSFVAALDELGGALGRFGKETKADQLLKIAGALIILAGALWIISQIDPNRLISAVAGMATSFGILLGGLAILDKIEAEPSIKASVALSLIAVAINILASAVAKMGALNPQQLTSGLIGISAAMMILIVAAERLDQLENGIVRSAAGLVIMATALAIMAGVIAIFGVMPMAMLIQGFIAITATLALLVGAAVILSKFAPQMVLSAVGLMAMAAALNMLVLPITTLGLLPFPVLLQGMLALGVILFGLVLAAQSLSAIAPQMAIAAVGMMAMAFALNMMVAPILALGMMDIMTLIVGIAALAVVLTILVIATNAMTTAMPGAVAMIAVAAALLILSVALAVMAGIGIEGIIIAILGLIGAVLAMAIISAILTPLIPVMGAVAGVMALFALGMLALAVAMMIGVAAIAMVGPALLMALGGIMAFQAAAEPMLALAGPMALFGAAMLAFGAGALVAGVGILVLGAGLIILGVGLALVAAVGILGAVALGKVIEKITGLMFHIPGMLAMGGAFLALGAGVVVLGAGLLVLGAGALLTGVALMLLVPLGALVALSINLIIKSIEKLVPVADQVGIIGNAMGKLGSATEKLADNGRSAASGLTAMGTSFTTLGSGAMVASVSIQMLAAIVPTAIAGMIAAIARGPAAFQAFATAVILSMTMMNAGLTAGSAQAQATATRLGPMVGALMVMGIASSYGSVYNASVTLGNQMTAGMNAGLQNGSYSVSQMASRVAQNALNAAKRTLGVASPSKEFTWLGEMSDKGLANGLANNAGMIEKAGTKVGNVALNAVRESLSELKNAVATDMDYNPTIRPILDMSAFKKGAAGIDGMLTPPSLKVDDSYAMANRLALQQEAVAEELELRGDDDRPSGGDTYIQNNYSPKNLSPAEIYRNTKNLISVKKGESPT